MNIMLILKDTVRTKDIMWVSEVTLRILVSSVTVSVLCVMFHGEDIMLVSEVKCKHYMSVRGQSEGIYVSFSCQSYDIMWM